MDWEDPLEEGTATHSSILAWRIPWTEEPGGLQSKWLQKSRIRLSDYSHRHTQSGTPVFGCLPRGVKTYVHTRNCPCTFIAALLIIAKAWKQPRRPSVGEWINKLWDVQTMGYYSVTKRNELSNHIKTWRKFKRMLLSGRSQFGKAACRMVPTV